ncbi:MAG: hypothetical protein FWF28_09855 [Micrococcales bacterium]|nr:hypothetical protein [Micrococcales bacterium]
MSFCAKFSYVILREAQDPVRLVILRDIIYVILREAQDPGFCHPARTELSRLRRGPFV